MNEILFIQLPESHDINSDTEEVFWFYLVDNQIQQSGKQLLSQLMELQEKFSALSPIVLVPSRDCLVTQVAIPSKQRRQQLKAVPFAVEEQLADDIEDIHFAIGKRSDDGCLPVIAVSNEKMQGWIQLFTAAGISAKAMLPSSSLLESPKDVWSIYQIADLFLINQNGNCWCAKADEAAILLQLSVQQLDTDNLPNILFWSTEATPGWLAGLGLQISGHSVQDSWQALLARYNSQSLNLMQGNYEVQDDWREGWKVWRKAAMFALFVILLKFSMMGFDFYRLSAEKAFLKDEIAKIYHQVAPGARITAYPERQMRQLLKQRQGGGNQSNSFLMMVAQVAKELSAIPSARPTNLNYNGNRSEIRLDLMVANLLELDKLKENLVAKGLSVEVGGANAQDNKYIGQLIIRSDS
ncbi:MAG: type II secretion system protein GspL [Gammaproteobacteria bacterium]|nr:type II secretion system protein GspL [Gammaproteobacteria bacterium]